MNSFQALLMIVCHYSLFTINNLGTVIVQYREVPDEFWRYLFEIKDFSPKLGLIYSYLGLQI